MQNIVGPPARGQDFYDREELVALLWDRLEGGNVLLAAPRRFGKTSVMYRLLDAPLPGWRPIHIDAESIREPVNFVIAVLDALMADHRIRNFLLERWKGAGKWLRDLVDGIEVTSPWGPGVKIQLKKRMGPQWQERAEALLGAVRDYQNQDTLLFIIDELPVMLYLFRDNSVPDADARAFLYWFRKLRTDPGQGLQNCRFLIGGSIGIERYLSQLGAAASFNDFERIPLTELSANKAADFLERLLHSRRLKLSAASRRKVLELVGAPIPYFIQVFVTEIATARASGLTRIGPKRIEAIYQDRLLGAACKTYFQHYYDRLRDYDKREEQAAKALLKAIALAAPAPVGRGELRGLFRRSIAEGATDEQFARVIADFENDFYIRYDRDRGGYAFASKILCDWWRRYYAF